MRVLSITLILLALSVPGFADLDKRGLLFNRTGLPLTLPLHVRTGPGHVYFVELSELSTNETGMAAFFEGGPLFRVLAPPGTWRLVIIRGGLSDWKGADQGFGGNGEVVFDSEVTFTVKGLRTRQGVLIDLLGGGA